MASLFESLKVRKIKKKPGSECWRSTKMVVGMGAHDRGERLRGLGLFWPKEEKPKGYSGNTFRSSKSVRDWTRLLRGAQNKSKRQQIQVPREINRMYQVLHHKMQWVDYRPSASIPVPKFPSFSDSQLFLSGLKKLQHQLLCQHNTRTTTKRRVGNLQLESQYSPTILLPCIGNHQSGLTRYLLLLLFVLLGKPGCNLFWWPFFYSLGTFVFFTYSVKRVKML